MKTIINKNYTYLLFATFITRLGDNVDSIAFSWLVYTMTGSRALMGSIFAISMIPNLIVLPFGGVIADVFNKKKVTIIGDVLRAVSVSTLALFYLFNILEVWHLFFFVSLNSLFESFANPARGGLLPSIVEEEDYIKGASWVGTASQVGSLIGLSLAGVLIAVIGVWGAIFVDGVTFLLSAITLSFLSFKDRRQEVNHKPKVKDYFILIGEGVTYLRSKKMLVGILLLAAYLNFSLVPFNVLRPIYVVEVLKLGVEGLSYLGIAILVGMTFGGLIMGKKGKNVNPITAIGFGLSLFSMMYMLMGIPVYFNFNDITNLGIIIIITFMFGFFLPVVNAPIQAVIMKTTAPEMIGRLASIIGVVSLCAIPLGGAFVSVIGESISVSAMFIFMGLSGLIITFTFWMFNRNAVIA